MRQGCVLGLDISLLRLSHVLCLVSDNMLSDSVSDLCISGLV